VAVVDDADAIAQPLRFFEMMRGEQHRGSAVGDLANLFEQQANVFVDRDPSSAHQG